MAKKDNVSAYQRERLLKILALATFLIFFQAYMVAPLLPQLAAAFGVSSQTIGLIVPAYLIPYGIATLFYAILSDRLGRRSIMFASLLAFIVLTALTATAQSPTQLIFWRLLTGLGASGVVPLALALMGILYPYKERGRPLGWLFGAMAGGMAFGSTFGAILEPLLTWRGLFLGVSVLGVGILALLLPYQHLLGDTTHTNRNVSDLLSAYKRILRSTRGWRTYAYVLINGLFHSGVYTWLGLYLAQSYSLSEVGIGLALLGYGVPGFLFGPLIGRTADWWGRRWLIPLGLGLAALAALVLIGDVPLLVAAGAITLLSLGYDMTQPLLAGIVSDLGQQTAGLAMGLNVFILFTAFGIGSFLFGEALRLGFSTALALFAAVQILAALGALFLFRTETTRTRPDAKPRESA